MKIALRSFLLIIFFVSLTFAQSTGILFLYEDCTGLNIGSLNGQNGWVKFGSGPEVNVANTDVLTYQGYDYGGGEYMDFPANSSTNGRIFHDFADSVQLSAPGATVYYSILLNVKSTSTTGTAYFFSLGEAGTSNYYAKLFAKQVTPTTYNLGVSKSSNTASFATQELNVNETYIVVVRYDAHNTDINQSSNICYMWINPVGSSEPDTSTADAKVWPGQPDYSTSYCSSVMWHNRGTNTPTASIDGLRVAGSPSSSADAWDALAPGPLPVELTSFTYSISNGKIVLNWRTATEVNNKGFEVERRSANEKSWTAIAFISGSGTSFNSRSYSYTDNSVNSGKFEYRLKQIDNNGASQYVGVLNAEMNTPNTFSLSQNYPNPFNPSTKIEYQIPSDSKVKIELYSITGQKLADLVDADQATGFYSLSVNTASFKGISSGIYLYKMTAVDKATGSSFVNTKKMTFMK